MRKFFRLTLCLLLALLFTTSSTAFAASYTAIKPTFPVLVDGERFYSDPPVVVIDGSTYLPLRALGDCLGVYVEWNSELSQVEVSTIKEVLPKKPTLENGYDRFDDVPDFTKVTNSQRRYTQTLTNVFGYITEYGYYVFDPLRDSAINAYSEALISCGFEVFATGSDYMGDMLFLFNAKTGRMVFITKSIIDNSVNVSIYEEKYTAEEWNGEVLPKTQFEAVTAGFKVMVDGNEFISDKPALVIDGRTYLPLRAMGDCLGVFVDWDAENSKVIVESAK